MIELAYEAIHSGPKLRFVSAEAVIYMQAGNRAKTKTVFALPIIYERVVLALLKIWFGAHSRFLIA